MKALAVVAALAAGQSVQAVQALQAGPSEPIPREDVQVGQIELVDNPHTATHDFAEIIYVVDGNLSGTVSGAPIDGQPGTVVLIAEGVNHSLSRSSAPEGTTLAFFRWAPEGDLATLHRQSTMTEPVNVRPAKPPSDRTLRRYESATNAANTNPWVHADEVDWTTNWTYSEELWKVYRYKPLVRDPLAEWPGIDRADVRMGLQELEPGAAYPTHHHPSPEIYMVLGGEAQWSVGDRKIEAGPGTTIYTPPDTKHRIENTGSTRLRWLYFWWAPGGDPGVFDPSRTTPRVR
jgi:quercetin dioxygenase-like cupin family protein